MPLAMSARRISFGLVLVAGTVRRISAPLGWMSSIFLGWGGKDHSGFIGVDRSGIDVIVRGVTSAGVF